MMNAIETCARWLGAQEATALIDQINRSPRYERMVSARRLGERMHLSNRERELLKLKTIKPFDMTDKQLAEQRRAKQRAGDRRRRRAAGSKPREASLARLKPWEAEGISRATWFRKQSKGSETNSRAKQKSHETNSRCNKSYLLPSTN